MKSKYDEECSEFDYAFGFVPSMIDLYGGKICTIKNVIYIPFYDYERNVIYKTEWDGFIYRLEEDIYSYKFSSSMFELEF